MTKGGYRRAPIGSTDVYSRKHIDKEFDRLERLRSYDKERIKELQERVGFLEGFLADGPHGAVYAAFKQAQKRGQV